MTRVRIVCISDTHGQHTKLSVPDGDVLVHAGDFTAFGDRPKEVVDFNQWLGEQHLRKHHNILKRQLMHVAGFNLSLIFRRLLGAGTPRELNNRARMLLWFLLGLFTRRQEHNRRCRSMIRISDTAPTKAISFKARSKSCRAIVTYATDC